MTLACPMYLDDWREYITVSSPVNASTVTVMLKCGVKWQGWININVVRVNDLDQGWAIWRCIFFRNIMESGQSDWKNRARRSKELYESYHIRHPFLRQPCSTPSPDLLSVRHSRGFSPIQKNFIMTCHWNGHSVNSVKLVKPCRWIIYGPSHIGPALLATVWK